MLNYFHPSTQGLIDNRPCALRNLSQQYPRTLKCEEPLHVLALLEEFSASLAEQQKREKLRKSAIDSLSAGIGVVIESLEGGRELEEALARLRDIEGDLRLLATGEF